MLAKLTKNLKSLVDSNHLLMPEKPSVISFKVSDFPAMDFITAKGDSSYPGVRFTLKDPKEYS